MSATEDQDPAASPTRPGRAKKASSRGKAKPPGNAPGDTPSKAPRKAGKKPAAGPSSGISAPAQKTLPAKTDGGAPTLATGGTFGRLDYETIADNMAQLVDQGRKALAAAIGGANPEETRSELAASVADATKTLGAVAEYWLSKPERAAAAQADLYKGLSEVWRQTMRRYSGEDVAPIVPSDLSDKRFADSEWNENPFFDWLRQSYLLASRWAGDMVERAEGLDPQTKARAAFYARLISSAISPSNFVPTNPELLRATIDAKGENLVRGLKMLAEDISAGGGVLKICQSAARRFRTRRGYREYARQSGLAQ